eukprot:2980810-Amphidinium_carterae.2
MANCYIDRTRIQCHFSGMDQASKGVASCHIHVQEGWVEQCNYVNAALPEGMKGVRSETGGLKDGTCACTWHGRQLGTSAKANRSLLQGALGDKHEIS